MFDSPEWSREARPFNQVEPDRVPNNSPGTYLVIVRLAWPDRVEFWPARAVRWTDAAVLFGVQVIANDWRSTRYLWVPPADVVRVMRRQADGSGDPYGR